MRRSLVAASAALAVGGSLAVAATASATSIPTGAATDTSNASLNGLLNQTNAGLIQAQNLIVLTNDIVEGNGGQPIDGNFTSSFTSASQLTAANVTEIGNDIASSANTADLEMGTCVAGYLKATNQQPSSSTIPPAYSYCHANTNGSFTAAQTSFTGTTQPEIATAAASWSGLTGLVALVNTDPTDFAGGLYTVDGDVSLSSTATITAIGKPVAYTATFGVSGAAATGFVLPQAFTLTFPANFNINTSLVADEIQASQESSPPSANVIGTATVTSPQIAALVPGSKGVDSSAQVFAVATSSLTQPEFEVYLGQGYYILGTVTGVAFPLTVTFGLPYQNGTQLQQPLPVSNVTMNFPATTSPLLATNCTDAGTLTGTMTDYSGVSALAAKYFNDTSDMTAQTMTASATTVTDQCKTISGVMHRLTSGRPTLTLKITTGPKFGTVTVGLPRGLRFVKAPRKILAKEVSGKAKVVRVIRGKLVVTLRSRVTSATVTTKRGLISESPALIKSIKKHRTKRLVVSVHAAAIALKAIVKA